MKIAIISDSHNNEKALRKFLNYCKEEKIETIIHCGDMASLEMMNVLNDNFSGDIHYTFGNADYDDLRNLESQEKYNNTFIHKKFGETEIDGKRIAFIHFPEVARRLTESGKYAFVFYGHTHQPWEETIGKCKMLNPGTLAGEIYLPTFAVWETKTSKFKLLRVDDLK